MRLDSAVICCSSLSISDTRHEYSPELSTVVSFRINSVTYTEAPDPCFSSNTPVPGTGFPLCIQWTTSEVVLTGSEVCNSQMITDD